jgi:hypothetical protein
MKRVNFLPCGLLVYLKMFGRFCAHAGHAYATPVFKFRSPHGFCVCLLLPPVFCCNFHGRKLAISAKQLALEHYFPGYFLPVRPDKIAISHLATWLTLCSRYESLIVFCAMWKALRTLLGSPDLSWCCSWAIAMLNRCKTSWLPLACYWNWRTGLKGSRFLSNPRHLIA